MKVGCGLVESLETWVFRAPRLQMFRDRWRCINFSTCGDLMKNAYHFLSRSEKKKIFKHNYALRFSFNGGVIL